MKVIIYKKNNIEILYFLTTSKMNANYLTQEINFRWIFNIIRQWPFIRLMIQQVTIDLN